MGERFSVRGRIAVAGLLLMPVVALACAPTAKGAGSPTTTTADSTTSTVPDSSTTTTAESTTSTTSSTTTTTTPGGGGVEPGCYDSDTNVLSLIYSGPMASYKNARLATNSTGCGSDLTSEWFTVVLAADQASATAACQAGPDPAVDGVLGLSNLGFGSLPTDTWMCGNPLSGGLLEPGQCFAVGSVSVKYLGPRNTKDNVTLHTASTTCATPPSVPAYTYVQHSTQAAAVAVCVGIGGGGFTGASSLTAVFPAMPNDTYLCT